MEATTATNATGVLVKFRRDRTAEWPENIKELASDLGLSRRPQLFAVARRFNTGELAVDLDDQPLKLDVPAKTIQNWVKDEEWIERHERFIQESAGGILKLIVGNMMQVALSGSHTMAAQAQQGVPPSKELTEAVKLATSVIGLSAIGSRDPSRGVLAGGSSAKTTCAI